MGFGTATSRGQERNMEVTSLFTMRSICSHFLVFSAIILVGCNQSNNDSQTYHEDAPKAEQRAGQHLDPLTELDPSQIPIIATSHNGDPEFKTTSLTNSHSEQEIDYSLPASGTPEWDIRQIALLIAKDSRKTTEKQGDRRTTILNIVSNDTARRIIAIASHAISATHNKPEKELIFNAAVQSMMDARLKLALAGEKESLDSIYEDAATLAKERPGTTASIIAAGTVVKLAQEMAKRTPSDSAWLSEYVRQVKIFATNFPQEEARSIMQLISAGEFCEQRQQILPAIECFTMIHQQFPSSPFRKKAETALQRLGLIGKNIALSGPTVSGGTFDLAKKAGRPVLLVFWSVRSQTFLQDVELINRLVQEKQYHLVGINMDSDGTKVKQFIAAHRLQGEHIFYNDFSMQGATQPIVSQFGINVVPTYWYIDEGGKVRATNVSKQQLQGLLGSR